MLMQVKWKARCRNTFKALPLPKEDSFGLLWEKPPGWDEGRYSTEWGGLVGQGGKTVAKTLCLGLRREDD